MLPKLTGWRDSMNKLYAVKTLFESITSPTISQEKIFEERIILIEAESEAEISNLLNSKYPPDTYLNSEGGFTTNQLVKILDVFELVDNLETSRHFKEVYSRYLIFDDDATTEQAIEKYGLDQ